MLRSLHTAASGMKAQELQIDVIAHNLANVNTTGFKRSRAEFQDMFYEEIRAASGPTDDRIGGSPNPLEVGHGTRAVGTQRIFSTGDLITTQNPMDLAIEGDGFFRVRMADGRQAFTRSGLFKTDADGQMVNAEGYPLDPPVFLPPDTVQLVVATDGTVKALQPGDTDAIEVGRVELARFVNPSGMKAMGHGLYLETEASGRPLEGLPEEEGMGRIAQGMLEGSNVEVVEEMIALIAAQRAYEINSKVITTADQVLQQAAQLR